MLPNCQEEAGSRMGLDSNHWVNLPMNYPQLKTTRPECWALLKTELHLGEWG